MQRGITGAGRRGGRRRAAGRCAAAIVDRAAAIEQAIELGAARATSCSIAGKGHEKYQVIGDRVLPFDDVAVAREALQRRRDERRRAVTSAPERDSR